LNDYWYVKGEKGSCLLCFFGVVLDYGTGDCLVKNAQWVKTQGQSVSLVFRQEVLLYHFKCWHLKPKIFANKKQEGCEGVEYWEKLFVSYMEADI